MTVQTVENHSAPLRENRGVELTVNLRDSTEMRRFPDPFPENPDDFASGGGGKGKTEHPLLDAVSTLAWPAPTREEVLGRGLQVHGDHVIRALGEDLPWGRLGTVAIETFKCAGSVYFVGGDVGAIKIGFSKYPIRRLADMQMGSPIKLRILALVLGPVALEREYHKRFASDRLHGEWFARTPEIEAEIVRLSTPSELARLQGGEG